jgi:hypothetical protein
MLGTSDPLTADSIGLDAPRVRREITAIPANRRKRGRRVQNCRMFISHKSPVGREGGTFLLCTRTRAETGRSLCRRPREV